MFSVFSRCSRFSLGILGFRVSLGVLGFLVVFSVFSSSDSDSGSGSDLFWLFWGWLFRLFRGCRQSCTAQVHKAQHTSSVRPPQHSAPPAPPPVAWSLWNKTTSSSFTHAHLFPSNPRSTSQELPSRRYPPGMAALSRQVTSLPCQNHTQTVLKPF